MESLGWLSLAFSTLPTYLPICLLPIPGQLMTLTWLGLTVIGCAVVFRGWVVSLGFSHSGNYEVTCQTITESSRHTPNVPVALNHVLGVNQTLCWVIGTSCDHTEESLHAVSYSSGPHCGPGTAVSWYWGPERSSDTTGVAPHPLFYQHWLQALRPSIVSKRELWMEKPDVSRARA